ncbi:ADP-ribosylglycohydrolase [compost metagenome]
MAAANGGFDSNSVAGMVGALAGAYHGRAGLPEAMVRELTVAPALLELAGKLEALAAGADAAKAR